MKTNKILYLLFFLPLFLVSCAPSNEDDYTAKWLGSWKTSDQVDYPMSKAIYSGNITKVANEDNKVLVSGTLFDLNESYSLPMTLTSEVAAKFDYKSNIGMEGTAKMNSKGDTITFYLTISVSGNSVKDTIIATKN